MKIIIVALFIAAFMAPAAAGQAYDFWTTENVTPTSGIKTIVYFAAEWPAYVYLYINGDLYPWSPCILSGEGGDNWVTEYPPGLVAGDIWKIEVSNANHTLFNSASGVVVN